MSAERKQTALVVPVPEAEHLLRQWRHLAPEPEEPFLALMAEIWAAYPDRPPYGGIHAGSDPVPHCTVAAPDGGALLAAAETALRPHLPLDALATEAWLVELCAEGWSVRAKFPFRGTA